MSELKERVARAIASEDGVLLDDDIDDYGDTAQAAMNEIADWVEEDIGTQVKLDPDGILNIIAIQLRGKDK